MHKAYMGLELLSLFYHHLGPKLLNFLKLFEAYCCNVLTYLPIVFVIYFTLLIQVNPKIYLCAVLSALKSHTPILITIPLVALLS